MREKIIRYEATGRGILSIKDAFYLTSSSSPPVIHLPRSSSTSFPRHPFPSHFVPPCRPRRHVAAASYLVLLKGYFSRPLPLFLHSHRFTKGARNWGASWEECLEITNHSRRSSSLLFGAIVRGEGSISLLSLKKSPSAWKKTVVFNNDCTIVAKVSNVRRIESTVR